ncbi:AAA family ATPase [Candidatus Methylospira mobilis]|uniref:ATP-dependent DNA helicase Rep n=1 Tax=Candidatus Methylospira mobilis TaxID=1808979 RepID=A0A5Q0BD19_9GAMM|nr:UvrD-helicase domain-containing protein [Candidatus Methylospira mobilis]QFY41803.1 AAA family ATPase [Candidatus Methylospira mobilis]WNV06667.1 3'-5' exonuclease [Candidatus Methylospira mobilis]
MSLPANLNPQQLSAIKTIDAPLLVIAGAGSGKTRLITEKIAYLIRQGTAARHICAVTFTNKAAREMKTRVSQIISGKETRGLRISTFHALGLEIVRREHKALRYKPNISLFDEQDKISLLKELILHGNALYDMESAGLYSSLISEWKNLGLLPEQALRIAEVRTELYPAALIYADYARQIKAYNAMDFDDLILQPVTLFQHDSDSLTAWRNRIHYLLVDEYQDTNITQYRMLKQLSGTLGRFTVVGDDDQSVYSWRGARPENINQLQADYPRLQVVKLEQNYRSSGRILKVANQLIANNPHIYEKKLWSAHGYGNPLRVLKAKDDQMEARQVVSDMVHHKFRNNSRFNEYALLYRGNHQSRLFERALREHNVPYFISGGTSFFSHVEVKDVLAYLRLIVNPEDDIAFLRIANTPRRELGPTTLEKLGAYAGQRRVSLHAACSELGLEQALPDAAIQRLRFFTRQIDKAGTEMRRENNPALLEQLLEDINYESWLRDNSSSDQQADRRMGNIRELIAWLKRISEDERQEPKTLDETLAKIMLFDILDRQEEDNVGDRVSLMTLHAAKGLEFPYVYLVGMEEMLLPHRSSIEENSIEEERRLAYVGITRAMKDLTFSYCSHRSRYGETVRCEPSRFLDELPADDLEWTDRTALSPEEKKERGQASLANLRNLLSE